MNRIDINKTSFKSAPTGKAINYCANKLIEFQKAVQSSEFCNSYTRYSIEFKLLQDAITEAKKAGLEDFASKLEKDKIQVITKLKTFGVQLKDI